MQQKAMHNGKVYMAFFKKLSLWMHTPIVMLQDVIWMTGRYDKAALQRFIDGYKPDVVFCP